MSFIAMDQAKMKLVIAELNRLLGKNCNLLSFDLLRPDQLQQLLSDTLNLVAGSDPVNLQEEQLEETVIRVLEMLRILKYKLNDDLSPALFRQGLVQGDKKIIHPILEWLVTNFDDLKKRSYLAQYLVKLEIPPEIAADADISYLYEQYEARIEEFKAVHKESEALKNTAQFLAEVKSDIRAMEAEKESVLKKIEKIKRQIEGLPDKNKFLEVAQALRREKEKQKELESHLTQQQNQLTANEHKLQRLHGQLRELRQDTGRSSPEELLRRLQEEYTVNAYLAKEKLPMEIKAREEEVRMYEMILREPSLTRAHLDDLNFKIQEINAEVNQMMEAQLSEQNPGEDKNAPFRQQAAIIARKKEAKGEQLSEIRTQLTQLEEELASKRKQLHEVAGETVLRGDDLKKYVSKLRVKGAQYKKQKAQLSALKTEAGILTRTLEILVAKDGSILPALENDEAAPEVEGFRDREATAEKIAGQPDEGRTVEEIFKSVTELNRKILEKKRTLEPIINELQPLREEYSEMKDQYEQLKKVYDSTASGLENSIARLQQEVEKLQNDHESREKEVERLKKEIQQAEEDLVTVQEELKLYVSGSAEAKKNSIREQLQVKMAEQEKLAKQLKEEQTTLKDQQVKNAQQLRYWQDLQKLFQCKLECLEDEKRNAGVVRRQQGAETLILPQ